MLSEQQHAFARVLDLIEEAGCMSFVVLIGSRCSEQTRGLMRGLALS